MTLTELLTAVKAFGYGTEDDTFITTYLNMAYLDVAGRRKWRWNESYTSVSTTAATETTALPSHLFLGDLRSLTIDLPTPVFVYNSSEIDDRHRQPTSTTQAKPQLYTIVGNDILWYPTPDAIYTYRLYRWDAPTPLSSGGDTPAFPATYHQILVEGALMHIASRDHNPSRMQEHRDRYEMLIQEMSMKDRARTSNATHLYLPKSYGGLYDIHED